MTEQVPSPETPRMTEAQEEKLRDLCTRYNVAYDASHYFIWSEDSFMTPGWAEGWLGGMRHANPDYVQPEEPRGKPSLYVGVSPSGEAHS